MGSGTTLVEAKLLNRNAVGVDINPQSVLISEKNLRFQCETSSKIFVKSGDATDLCFMKDSHIDFICTHPPYADIIKYSKGIGGGRFITWCGGIFTGNAEGVQRILSCAEKGQDVRCNDGGYKKK